MPDARHYCEQDGVFSYLNGKTAAHAHAINIRMGSVLGDYKVTCAPNRRTISIVGMKCLGRVLAVVISITGLMAQQYCLSGVVSDASGKNTFQNNQPIALSATVKPGNVPCLTNTFCSASVSVQAQVGTRSWAEVGTSQLLILFDGNSTTLLINTGLTLSNAAPQDVTQHFSLSINLSSYPKNLIATGYLPDSLPPPNEWPHTYNRLYDGFEYDMLSYSGQLCANSPPDCAINAIVDSKKIRVSPSKLWQTFLVADDTTGLEYFRLMPGYHDESRPQDDTTGEPGIDITVGSDAVTYPLFLTPFNIVFKFINNLENWTGDAYYEKDTSIDPQRQRSAKLSSLNGTDVIAPLVDYTSKNPPWYDDRFGILQDRPSVTVPVYDNEGTPLTRIHYTKTFVSYFGCHVPDDLVTFPTDDTKRFLHVLARVRWGVNYFGKFAFTQPCFAADCAVFIPDVITDALNPNAGPGVWYETPEIVGLQDSRMKVSEPTANGNTNYVCLGGVGVCQ